MIYLIQNKNNSGYALFIGMKTFLSFLMGLLLLTFSACGGKKPEAEAVHEELMNEVKLTPEQMENAGIIVDSIRQREIHQQLKVNGMVDVPPQNIVSVSFPLGGYLKTTHLLPGMHVNRGEVIAMMEDPALVQLQQDYLMAKARLAYLEKDLERQRFLNENEVNADKVLQQAQSDYSSQKILLKGYAEKLKLIGLNPEKLSEESISRSVPIRSPINGFVSKINVNIGKYVNPSDVLFELINPDDMHAALTVFEKDLALVKPKQKVWVTFVDEPEREYECEVLLVSRNVDQDRGALVHCHFEQQPDRLLPGMFLNARILISSSQQWAVPADALVRFENKDYLLEAKDSLLFHLFPVEKIMEENGWIAVKSDADDLQGRKFVVRNPYPVLGAMKAGEEEGHDH